MTRLFRAIRATPDEMAAPRPGDDIVLDADVVMDHAFTVHTPPEVVWPWLLQLGKRRAGWYLPRSVERFVPRSRRGSRSINVGWQGLRVGDVIPDYGGRTETFAVAILQPPTTLVYTSRRGHTDVSWALALTPVPGPVRTEPSTRVHLRLRLGPVRRKRLAETAGSLIDALTVAGLAAGLRERLPPPI